MVSEFPSIAAPELPSIVTRLRCVPIFFTVMDKPLSALVTMGRVSFISPEARTNFSDFNKVASADLVEGVSETLKDTH